MGLKRFGPRGPFFFSFLSFLLAHTHHEAFGPGPSGQARAGRHAGRLERGSLNRRLTVAGVQRLAGARRNGGSRPPFAKPKIPARRGERREPVRGVPGRRR